MTLALVWSDEAKADLLDILEYISARNRSASQRLQEAISYTAERLPDHPYIHRPGRIPGTREAVVHPNYILIYHVTTDAIEVLTLIHARQQYP
jgi:addiction module RelE/StbE family toxin